MRVNISRASVCFKGHCTARHGKHRGKHYRALQWLPCRSVQYGTAGTIAPERSIGVLGAVSSAEGFCGAPAVAALAARFAFANAETFCLLAEYFAKQSVQTAFLATSHLRWDQILAGQVCHADNLQSHTRPLSRVRDQSLPAPH